MSRSRSSSSASADVRVHDPSGGFPGYPFATTTSRMGSLRLVTTRIPRALVLLAALAFLGALFRLTERQADQQNGQRLRDFQSISYLAARESRLIDVRRTDPE